MGPAWAARAPEGFEVRLAGADEVGLVDEGERDQFDRVDLDAAVTHAVATTGLHLRPPPESEGHGDLTGQDLGTKLSAELHRFTL